MDGYYIGRTSTLSFIASQFVKRESLPKSERIRFFVNIQIPTIVPFRKTGASLDIYQRRRDLVNQINTLATCAGDRGCL